MLCPMCGIELAIKQGRCASCGEPLVPESQQDFETAAATKGLKFQVRAAAFLWILAAIFSGGGSTIPLSSGLEWNSPEMLYGTFMAVSALVVLIGAIGLLLSKLKLAVMGLVMMYSSVVAILIAGGGRNVPSLLFFAMALFIGHSAIRKMQFVAALPHD